MLLLWRWGQRGVRYTQEELGIVAEGSELIEKWIIRMVATSLANERNHYMATIYDISGILYDMVHIGIILLYEVLNNKLIVNIHSY